MRTRGATACLALIGLTVLGPSGPAGASGHCTKDDAVEVVAIDGEIVVRAVDGATRPLALGDLVCPGEVVSAGETGRVELRFPTKQTTIGVARNSTVRIPGEPGAEGDVTLESGVLRFISSVRGLFTVETRHANAGIDGTEAVVASTASAGTLVLVAEGDVTLSGAGGTVALDAGEAGYAAPGSGVRQATTADDVPAVFRGLLADPAGASDWAIHYPPVLLAAGSGDPAVRAAAEALEAGDPDGAEALLAGRPGADALALASVVAVFRNRPAEGLDRARAAVAADPGLGAAHVAESYALQASGDVDAALDAAARAAEVAPQDAFAQARLAEMHLIAGDAPGAGKVAARSVAIRPTSLGHAVLGLSELAASRYDAAAASFAAGSALDSEDPLPRLGNALLLIRQGEIEAGAREMELAQSLDPRRASTRNLLGRAYAAEKAPEKALSQFDYAAEQDPDDPSPWLSAAETLFALNRPIEAMESLRQAEARSDGRAVLRSVRGLGEDQAIRGAALGRIQDVLGFSQQAIQTGAAAAEQDPANAAAHRALADVLENKENADQVRASSAFRAFVYSQPNTAPIQPSVQESDLALLNTPGATRPSFAELTPFYDSDGFRLYASGFGGTQDTIGDEVSVVAMHHGVSLGIGQFHYETDGYRFNNDVNHDVISVQGKAQLLPMVDVFAEYRYRDTRAGDRTLEFDLSNGDSTIGLEDERNLARFGAHGRIGANHDVAAVFTWVGSSQQTRVGTIAGTSIANAEADTFDVQAQHVGRFGPFTTVSGLSWTEFDGTGFPFVDFGFGPFALPPVTLDQETFGGYSYITWTETGLGFLSSIELTAGISIDHLDTASQLDPKRTRVNPKIGARIEVMDRVTLRAALTRSVTPIQLVAERLEPVTVAGFTQFIDHLNNTEVWQAGAGIDIRYTDWLTAGAEVMRRRIEQPRTVTPYDPETREIEINGYVDMTLTDQLAASLDVHYLDAEANPGSGDLGNYEVLEASAGGSWFHPEGFFASAKAGYVWHSFTGVNGAQADDFPIAELSLGYRLPNQRGIVSLDIQNAFDTDFGFEDRPVEGGTNPLGQPFFAREFTVLGRIRLNF